jgi:MFS family permease
MKPVSYRWVIVGAGGLLGCVAIGGMFSLPVFLLPIARDTGWSVMGVSTAMTVGFLAMALASMVWGTLSDRFGPRGVVLAGSVLLAGSLALASRATSLLQFQILFGGLVGTATAAIFAPLMACVTGWFETQRSLAVSLVSAGMGMAPMTMSPLAAWLVSHYDWRTSLLVIAGVTAGVMLPTALLIRRPPALVAAQPVNSESADADAAMSMNEALRSPQFIILLLTNFFCCATHSGPIFHTVSYAISCGIPMITAVTIYSVEGFAGLFGRLAFGVLGDRLGAKRVLVSGLLLQAFGALAYYFVHQLAGFYAAAATFGFIYSGVMPLYAVLARENFPLRMIGTVIGGTTMAGSLGMAAGPVVGGMIFDRLGSYGWLYLGSSAMGLGAFMIALTFKPRLTGAAEATPASAH